MNKEKKLTPNGVAQMMQSEAESERIIVQLMDIKPTKTGRIEAKISDGHFFIEAIFNPDSIDPSTSHLI